MSGTCGPTSARQFAFFDPDSSSLKMWPDISLWGWITFSGTLPKTGLMCGGRLFELPTSVRRITGQGSSFLPTPVAQPSGNSPEDHLRKKPGRTQVTDLSIIAENGLIESGGKLLPTPKASDGEWGTPRTSGRPIEKSTHLGTRVTLLPTPTASDSTGGGQHPDKRKGHTQQLIDTVLSIGDHTPPLFGAGSEHSQDQPPIPPCPTGTANPD